MKEFTNEQDISEVSTESIINCWDQDFACQKLTSLSTWLRVLLN